LHIVGAGFIDERLGERDGAAAEAGGDAVVPPGGIAEDGAVEFGVAVAVDLALGREDESGRVAGVWAGSRGPNLAVVWAWSHVRIDRLRSGQHGLPSGRGEHDSPARYMQLGIQSDRRACSYFGGAAIGLRLK